MKKITIYGIKEVKESKSHDGSTYIRVGFLTRDENEVEEIVKSNFSKQQFEGLKNLHERFKRNEKIEIALDKYEGKATKGGKPYVDKKAYNYNGYSGVYHELSVAIFIEEKLVQAVDFEEERKANIENFFEKK